MVPGVVDSNMCFSVIQRRPLPTDAAKYTHTHTHTHVYGRRFFDHDIHARISHMKCGTIFCILLICMLMTAQVAFALDSIDGTQTHRQSKVDSSVYYASSKRQDWQFSIAGSTVWRKRADGVNEEDGGVTLLVADEGGFFCFFVSIFAVLIFFA